MIANVDCEFANGLTSILAEVTTFFNDLPLLIEQRSLCIQRGMDSLPPGPWDRLHLITGDLQGIFDEGEPRSDPYSEARRFMQHMEREEEERHSHRRQREEQPIVLEEDDDDFENTQPPSMKRSAREEAAAPSATPLSAASAVASATTVVTTTVTTTEPSAPTIPECGICMSNQVDAVFLPCGHTACFYCALRWYNQHGTCPICRIPLRKHKKGVVKIYF